MRKPTLLLLCPLLLAGCGGGGSSHSGGGVTTPEAKGTATVSIVWPTRTARFVPVASNSIVVNLALNGVAKGQQVVPRPADGGTTSANFTNLAYGNYTASLAAYPNADGTGTAQARGAASLRVAEDAPGAASVSLATTVVSLSILPAALDKKGTATVSVGAMDADGATVLLAVGDAAETIVWSADKVPNSLGAMVDAVALSAQTGNSITLTGVHSGTTHVRATLGLGLPTPLVGSGTVTVNAIADGSGTVTVS